MVGRIVPRIDGGRGCLLAWGLAIGVLGGCATRQATSQALTVVGAAAVVVGASMASGGQCYDAFPGDGGAAVYCSPGLSRGARRAGTGLAVAGVGLAAAGYALTPKGPDRLQPPTSSPAAPVAPYRLIRAPAPEAASSDAAGCEAPGAKEAAAERERVEGASPREPVCPPEGGSLKTLSPNPEVTSPGRH